MIAHILQEWLSQHAPNSVTQGQAIADILEGWQCDNDLITAGFLYPAYTQMPALIDESQRDTTAKQIIDPAIIKMIRGAASMQIIHHVKRDQAEPLRKMMLAMVDDVRTVLLKLAERLFFIKHLQDYDSERQKIIAQETLDYYAPLANRLGIGQLKWQLEDGAFACLHPDAFQKINSAFQSRREEREHIIQEMIRALRTLLEKNGVKNSEFSGRVKHVYSIYKKTLRKQVDVEHIFDASAIRVIVPTITDCYTTLSLVHEHWQPIPEEFDDYIAKPKLNGYRSIHTAILREDHTSMEIQIRTREMHEAAELGIAAHWKYKENRSTKSTEEQKVLLLRELLDWQKNTLSDREALYRKAFHDHVYAFSPAGDVYDLEQGATPLDFAYHVHTDIGHRCRGAKVNGVMVPLTSTLKTGDHVDIITAKEFHPSHDWVRPELGYLKTSRAIQKVKHWYRKLAMEAIAEKAPSTETRVIAPTSFHPKKGTGNKQEPKKPLSVKTDVRFLMHVALCCNPKAGDDIIGYVTQGRGISVHQKKCRNMQNALQYRSEKLMDMNWEEGQGTVT